jgi:hypothetical protein
MDLILLRFAAEAMIGEIRIVPGFKIRFGTRRVPQATPLPSIELEPANAQAGPEAHNG